MNRQLRAAIEEIDRLVTNIEDGDPPRLGLTQQDRLRAKLDYIKKHVGYESEEEEVTRVASDIANLLQLQVCGQGNAYPSWNSKWGAFEFEVKRSGCLCKVYVQPGGVM